MSSSNCIADVRRLCTAALKKGHAQHGVVQAPASWAKLAGYSGSAASPLRAHMARRSGNGVGRSGRYGPQSAGDMLELLARADAFVEADTKAKQDAASRKVRQQLEKNRQAARQGARAAKGTATTAKRSPRKAKAEQPTEEVVS